jgi:FKBP-type peptidyl-prolyl cis-trans isomerase
MISRLTSKKWTLIAVAVLAAHSALLSSCSQCSPDKAAIQSATQGSGSMLEKDVTDLKIEELTVGTGALAETGKSVKVHYTGWLTNGTKFDSSVDRDQPFQFNLGAGQVIKGWDQGVAGMKIGGKRKLTIPYTMAYGEAGHPPVIPPKSTLVFEVQLLDVQ